MCNLWQERSISGKKRKYKLWMVDVIKGHLRKYIISLNSGPGFFCY